MKRGLLFFLLVVLLSIGLWGATGCSTTLHHPATGQTYTCKSGAWWGFGIIGLPIAIVGNLLELIPYRECIEKAQAAGYQEQEKPDTPPADDAESRRIRQEVPGNP